MTSDIDLCDRCGSYTNFLEETALMSRGVSIASWMLCLVCRNALRVEDLLDLVKRELDELRAR